MSQEPSWNISDLLAKAGSFAGKRIVALEDSPAVYMRAGLGYEDYLVATGKMDARIGKMDPQERIRVRRLFIPRRPK